MARYWFGDSDDWSLSINGDGSLRRTPSTRKYYDAETGGVQHSDLLINGTTPADSVSSSGLPVRFQGPDGVLAMWESANNGPRVLVQSTDIPQVVADAATSIEGAVVTAEAALASVQTAAQSVTDAADEALADLLGLSGTVGLALDTDGVPYFDPSTVTGPPTLAVLSDTDGNPYLVGA